MLLNQLWTVLCFPVDHFTAGMGRVAINSVGCPSKTNMQEVAFYLI